MGKGWKRKACADRAQRAAAEAANLTLPVDGELQNQESRKTRGRNPHRRHPAFLPEPTGIYITATDSRSRVVDMLHGEIVNRLAGELTARGYEVANTGLTDDVKPDLVVMGESPAIIEVKTGCTLQDVKDILGQLFLYDYRIGAPGKTRMKAVVPCDINEECIAALRYYGICLIRWQKCGGDIIFKGLKSSFPQKK